MKNLYYTNHLNNSAHQTWGKKKNVFRKVKKKKAFPSQTSVSCACLCLSFISFFHSYYSRYCLWMQFCFVSGCVFFWAYFVFHTLFAMFHYIIKLFMYLWLLCLHASFVKRWHTVVLIGFCFVFFWDFFFFPTTLNEILKSAYRSYLAVLCLHSVE